MSVQCQNLAQIIIICSRQTLILAVYNQPNKSDFRIQEFCVDNGIRKMQTFFQNFFICTSQVNLLTQLTQNYDGNWDHLASLQKLLVFLTTQRGQPKYFKNVGEKFGKNFPREYHEAILLVHQLHALNFCSPNCGNFDILFPALEILAETKKLQNTIKRNQIGVTLVYQKIPFFKKQLPTFLRYFTFLSVHMSTFLQSRYHSK